MFLLIFRKIIFKSAWTFGSFQFAWIYFLTSIHLDCLRFSDILAWKCYQKTLWVFTSALFTWAFFTCEDINLWICLHGQCLLEHFLLVSIFTCVDLWHGHYLLEHSLLVSIFTCGSLALAMFTWAFFTCEHFTCVNCVKFTCVTCVYCTSVPKLVWMVICAQEGFTFSWVQLFLWIGLPSV